MHDNTLIVFCSDHGEMLGDHRMGAKGEWYEGSARVPMIMRLPHSYRNRHRNTTCEQVVTLGDLLPTFAAVAGADQPETSDGIDMLAQLEGRAGRDYLLMGQGFTNRNDETISWAGVTDGRWKYAWSFADGREQLFDLRVDHTESRDLIMQPTAESQAKREELKAITEQKLAEGRGARFLRDGKLWKKDGWTRPPREQVLGRSFPGFMHDTHANDALH